MDATFGGEGGLDIEQVLFGGEQRGCAGGEGAQFRCLVVVVIGEFLKEHRLDGEVAEGAAEAFGLA